MDVTNVESRRNKILEFIIKTYVETAAPVGSHAVCQRFHLRVSPATVRNVMGELEGHRLLSHPHTSAGRVPTDQGYRYYVDHLMVPQTLTESEAAAIEALGRARVDDPLELLETASHVVAELTGEASAVLAPRPMHGTLRRIELIPVDTRRVLGVLMTTEGLLRHAVLELNETVDAAELGRVSRFLNEELGGHPLADVPDRLQQALMDATNAFTYLYKRAFELWSLGGFVDLEETMYVEGASHVLAQPEFRDAQRGRQFLEVLELEQPFTALLARTREAGRRQTMIGSEIPYPSLTWCSVVSAPYRVGPQVAGAVGVIGPTRMEYPRAVAVVDRVAEVVGRAMERFAT